LYSRLPSVNSDGIDIKPNKRTPTFLLGETSSNRYNTNRIGIKRCHAI
jgi:hypothetical protein